MKNTVVKKTMGIGLVYLAAALAVLVEWLAGSACVTPQVAREVQTAEPLEPHQTQGSVSGGATWTVSGVSSMGVPGNPNADLNLLIRRGKKDQKEIQVPLNLSVRLGPGIEDEQWWGVHAATGLFFKRSKLTTAGENISLADRKKSNFWLRPLYKAWILGPTLGVFLSENHPSANSDAPGAAMPGFEPYYKPFVSPFAGIYFRYVTEKRKQGFVGSRGFLASINYFFLDLPLWLDEGFEGGFPLGIELFLGGFAGSERRTFIHQFTYGIGTDRNLMPRLVIGFTFGSKGRLL